MRPMFWTLPAVAILLAALSSGLPAQQPDENDRAALVRGNNEFAFELYGQLDKQPGNLFFSPYSISTALAMTYAGARGKTAEQMAEVLHFTLPSPRLHDAFSALASELQSGGKKRTYELHVANRLWGQKGYHFLPEFLQLTKARYGAELGEVDFTHQTEKARETINKWVAQQTKDKIKDLIARSVLDPATRLVLTNATYFKGAWAHPFSEKATKKEDFHLSADKNVSVPMMHQKEDCPFYQEKDFSMVSLPYQGYDLAMIVLLPAKVDGLPALEKSLSEKALAGWLKKMQRRRVDLTLPKFKMTAQFRLGKVLSALGMRLAFSSAADFSGISSEEKLKISQVIHKAYVDVNEKGTEAAAATAVIVGPTAVPLPPPPATFRADHPFVFLLRDTRTGSILFMGRLVNPGA
jgi:serpin B